MHFLFPSLSETLMVKVSDFGMARQMGPDGCFVEEDVRRVKLPMAWTAPEAISTGRFNAKTDFVSTNGNVSFRK